MKKTEKGKKKAKKRKKERDGIPASAKRRLSPAEREVSLNDEQLLSMIREVKKLARERRWQDVEVLLRMSEIMRIGLVEGPASRPGKKKKKKKKSGKLKGG